MKFKNIENRRHRESKILGLSETKSRQFSGHRKSKGFSREIKDTYVIRLDRGEKIIESLKNFCTKNKIKCGYFFGIGALGEVELAHYIVENKKYTSKKFNQPLEIVNMTGNITTMNKKVYLHCHITLSDEKMKAIAGHLKEGTIAAACEIILVKLNASINRKHDDLIGLKLLDL